MNPFLAILALLAGFGITWGLTVTKAGKGKAAASAAAAGQPTDTSAPSRNPFKRQQSPVDEPTASVPTANGATAAGLAAGAGAGAAAAGASAASHEVEQHPQDADLRTRIEGASHDLNGTPDAELTEEISAPVNALTPQADAPEDGSTPEGYTVKGDTKARLYLVPSDPDFARAHPDTWFLDERAAIECGYAHYARPVREDRP